MKITVLASLLLLATVPVFAQPSTTNNNDSCDISVQPAATLLLPYFEVDTAATPGTGTTTLFTVTNASAYPQIAHVTVWTDWAFPVLNFNLFLTGYDVQGINLYDVIVRGVVVPSNSTPGTSITTAPGSPIASSALGSTPLSNTANPNFLLAGSGDVRFSCRQQPGNIGTDLAAAVMKALTTGNGDVNCGLPFVGFNHTPPARAAGYITIDVVSYCTNQFASDSGGTYFAGPTSPLLFDNVLFGDYQQIGPIPFGSGGASTFDAGGNPMVHIRAVPEGGFSGVTGGVPIGTNLPFTFYDRYTPEGERTADRRQPLPSTWAARYIDDSCCSSSSRFATGFKIWREGVTRRDCLTPPWLNSAILISDVVRFDEHENSWGYGVGCGIPEGCKQIATAPASSRLSTEASAFPSMLGTDVGGWMYLNLSSGARSYGTCIAALSAQRAGFGTCNGEAPGSNGSRTTSQNWVVTSMYSTVGTNRLSVDFDAVALANGCTPAAAVNSQIAPATQRRGLLCPPNAPAFSCAPNAVRPPVNP